MKSVSPLVFSANLKTIINIPTLPLSKVLPPFSILANKNPCHPNFDKYIFKCGQIHFAFIKRSSSIFNSVYTKTPCHPNPQQEEKHYDELGCHHMLYLTCIQCATGFPKHSFALGSGLWQNPKVSSIFSISYIWGQRWV